MAEKRMFQILDEMNVADGENKTSNVALSNHLVSANTARGGGHVTMGVPADIITKLATDSNVRAILMVIDHAEYDRVSKLPLATQQ